MVDAACVEPVFISAIAAAPNRAVPAPLVLAPGRPHPSQILLAQLELGASSPVLRLGLRRRRGLQRGDALRMYFSSTVCSLFIAIAIWRRLSIRTGIPAGDPEKAAVSQLVLPSLSSKHVFETP